MIILNVTMVVVALAVLLYAPGVRRLTFGEQVDTHKRNDRLLAAGAIVVTAFYCVFAVLTADRLDYGHYVGQWQIILDNVLPPWGEHTNNAYGPLYNLLAYAFRIDPYLPKCLFVGAWVWSVVFISARALREHEDSRIAFGLALVLLFSPLLPILTPFYGFFDILPGVFCLIALQMRIEKRDGWAGVSLAAAVLLKYYPLALLPFLMLDGRRVRWRLGGWCVGLIAVGMILSLVVWGESTLYPLGFASDRESKWLSIFRFLRGPYSPLGLVMDDPNVDHLSVPAMVLFCGVTWLWCWWKRVPLAPACIAGLAVGLQFYKVGHKQFQVPLVLLIAYGFAVEDWLSRRRFAVLWASVGYFVWLTVFTIVYAILRRYSREGLLLSIREFTGAIGLAMTAWLVLPMLTLRQRKPQADESG